jgi:ABC-type multidrug transport system fused ATPase/permease subunit
MCGGGGGRWAAGFINNFTELELKMNGIERVKYYTEVSSEAPYDAAESDSGDGGGGGGGRGSSSNSSDSGGGAWQLVVPPANWPQHARVVFRGVSARYRKGLDLVLNDVSFTVEGGTKIGVCGRTGSGKSSMMLTLFRILELDSGTIEIDGIDTRSLGLSRLRQAIAMLPQDPTLFSGSIRQNLDPFGKHDDGALWRSLEQAELRETIEELPEMLDQNVGDGGEMLSVGQRQLLCLARAVLRDTKLLVMDECTASVDVRTDAKLQKMIREVFHSCTVFAIAHRLGTIIDYDRVAVLDQGRLVEFGSPVDLLGGGHEPQEGKAGTGAFAQLVDRCGASMAAHLRSVVRGEVSPSFFTDESN